MDQEIAAKDIIYKFTQDTSFKINEDEFLQKNASSFFHDDQRTPNSVKDKMKELVLVGLDEFATIKDYIKASIKKARKPL